MLRFLIKGLTLCFSVVLFTSFSTTQANPKPVNLFVYKTTKAVHGDSMASYHTTHRDNLKSLSHYMKKQGLGIDTLLQDPRFKIYEGIGDRFKKSAERTSPNLNQYKRILGFDHKKKQIARFMDTYADQLNKAEKKYGIPKTVISAIIGVESDFGKNTGRYNPFNTYVSMYAVGYRKSFAQSQLKELMEFVKRNDLDVFTLKSSYAGAMAFAQFIPYSVNKWFVGKDLLDMNNNIMSVANYLSYFKKRTGSIEKAVLRYNPSSLYTRAVLDLAKEARDHSASG